MSENQEFKQYVWYDYFVSKDCIVKNKNGQILTPQKNANGYFFYELSINGKRKRVLAHRLLMYVWQPNINFVNLQVNHIDFDKSNNKLSNLEWCSPKENSQHYHKNKKSL